MAFCARARGDQNFSIFEPSVGDNENFKSLQKFKNYW